MTTWLPLFCAAILAVCSALGATDPLFSDTRRDRILGAILGAIAGTFLTVGVYITAYILHIIGVIA